MATERTRVAPGDRLVFPQAIEGMLKRLPPELLDGPLRAELRAVGLDLDKPMMPGYPYPTFVAVARLTAQAAFPELPKEEALNLLGRRLVEGYGETLVGKALMAVLRLIGPRRALLRTEKNFRSANNYTECRFTEISPTQFEMWMNDVDGEPSYTAGIVAAGLDVAGGQGVQVRVGERLDGGVVFHCSWA